MIACAATHVVGSLIVRDNVQISSSILKQDCKQVTHATKMQTQCIRTQRKPMQATRTLLRVQCNPYMGLRACQCRLSVIQSERRDAARTVPTHHPQSRA